VSPVKYELGFCIPEDDILHSHCRENFKSFRGLKKNTLTEGQNVSVGLKKDIRDLEQILLGR
jgi:hypothetical protein